MHFFFDTETDLIAPGRLAPELVCLQYARDDAAPRIDLPIAGIAWRTFLDAAHRGATFVGANVAYDLAVMVEHATREHRLGLEAMRLVFDMYDQGRVSDVQIREQLLDIRLGTLVLGQGKSRRYSLAALTKKYTGRELDKGEESYRLKYRGLIGVPLADWPEAAVRYALDDAHGTRDVWRAQHKAAEAAGYLDQGLLVDERRQCRAAWALHLASAWGVRTERAKVEELKRTLEGRLRESEGLLRKAGVVRSGGRKDGSKDMAEIRRRVLAACKETGREVVLTDGGDVATSAEALEGLTDPVLVALADYSEHEKLLGTFVPTLEQGTEYPINTRFNVLVATGRTSSENPNLQQLPRAPGVRDCFVPRPGNLFSSCDYSALELRTLAQVCVDLGFGSSLREEFLRGEDPHTNLGARLGGVSLEWMRDPANKQQAKAWRQGAKAANFGYPGGLGARSFAAYAKSTYDLTLSQSEAEQMRAMWMAARPEMAHYFAAIARGVGDGTTTITQLRSGRKRGQVGYTQACNTLFQGLAADGAKDALYHVAKESYTDPRSVLWDSRPVVFAHDEIVSEHPEELAGPAATRVAEIMVERMRVWTPDVPQVVEPALMRRWLKSAEPRFNEARELIPYEEAAK